MINLEHKSILVTGGTGSFGRRFIRTILKTTNARRVIVFSRDELKQFEMQQDFPNEPRLRFFIGDVRDKDRLYRAFEDVQIVVHAAALKQVPAAENNPLEAIKTNVFGAQNIIDAALDRGISHVVALSTDKAAAPINLYGATKLCSDKLFVAANNFKGSRDIKFSVVRYGNVMGSRGSVIPLFKRQQASGKVTITDPRMTRFFITLEQGVNFVLQSFSNMVGGEIFVPKIPSVTITDVAKAIAPDCEQIVSGIRPGEKLHEIMVTEDDARYTMEFPDMYVIQPQFHWWNQHSYKISNAKDAQPCMENFNYRSDTNPNFLTVDEIAKLAEKHTT